MKNLISLAQNTTDTTILEDIINCAERLQIVTNRELIIQYASTLKLAIEDSGDIDALLEAAKEDILQLPTDTALEVYNVLFEGFGVESSIGNDYWSYRYLDIVYLYVNMGDAYTDTLVYDVEKGELAYTTLGDYVEQKELEQQSKYYLFCDSHHGVYCWQMSAQQILADHKAKICKANKEALPILRKVAKAKDLNRESYTWNIENLEGFDWLFEDSEGQRWALVQQEDIWAVKQYEDLRLSRG